MSLLYLVQEYDFCYTEQREWTNYTVSVGGISRENAEIHRIFLGADLTLAEIESGVNSYEESEQSLIAQMVKINVDENVQYTVEKNCNYEKSRT